MHKSHTLMVNMQQELHNTITLNCYIYTVFLSRSLHTWWHFYSVLQAAPSFKLFAGLCLVVPWGEYSDTHSLYLERQVSLALAVCSDILDLLVIQNLIGNIHIIIMLLQLKNWYQN